MNNLQYLIWFVATAVMTASVLTVGTLTAAGLLTRDKDARQDSAEEAADHPAEVLHVPAESLRERRTDQHAA